MYSAQKNKSMCVCISKKTRVEIIIPRIDFILKKIQSLLETVINKK